MTSITEIDGVNAALAADGEALLTSISNHVELAGDNVAIEMLQLAAEVYGPDFETKIDYLLHDPLTFEVSSNNPGRNTGATVADAPTNRHWHGVEASELGMAKDHQSFPVKYSFVGGQYQGLDANGAEANALVLTGLVHDPVSGTDKRTLALVIRGTDQLADAIHDYESFGTHYDKFAPLVDALHNYLATHPDDIDQILISGHSLGSGVVPYFLRAFPDTASYTVRAYVDGPTGSEAFAGYSRFVNFVHAGKIYPGEDDHRGDGVAVLGEISQHDYTNIGGTQQDTNTVLGWINSFLPSGIDPKTRDGSDILIDSDVLQAIPTGVLALIGPQHNHNLYAADLAKLVRIANDDNSPFAWTDASKTQHSALALALRSGTVYQGPPVAIAVGQPDATELNALLEPIKPHTHHSPHHTLSIRRSMSASHMPRTSRCICGTITCWARQTALSVPPSIGIGHGNRPPPGALIRRNMFMWSTAVRPRRLVWSCCRDRRPTTAIRRQAPLSGSRRTSTGSIPLASSISSASYIGPIRCCSCRRRHRPRLPARMSGPQRSPSSCCTSTARP